MRTLTTFHLDGNKPRIPRSRPPFETTLLSRRLRLALASLELARDPHIAAATEQVQAALDQVEGETQ